jgi:hypothetical protein
METLWLIVTINLVSWLTIAMGRLVLRLRANGVARTAILNTIRPIFALARPSFRRNGMQKARAKSSKGSLLGQREGV